MSALLLYSKVFIEKENYKKYYNFKTVSASWFLKAVPINLKFLSSNSIVITSLA